MSLPTIWIKGLAVVWALTLIALLCLACGFIGSRAVSTQTPVSQFSEDERHRLYAAALAASDSPIDTDTFKQVCRRIGIFDLNGKPNDYYIAFVSQHVEWAIKSETDQFRREIDSKDKAREYIDRHLLAR
jgi:hypothetical protein